jgi:hypothetical protein
MGATSFVFFKPPPKPAVLDAFFTALGDAARH